MLNDRQKTIVHDIVRSRRPDLLRVLETPEFQRIPSHMLRAIQECIGDELAARGVAPDGTINDVGRELEPLIDYFSPWHK